MASIPLQEQADMYGMDTSDMIDEIILPMLDDDPSITSSAEAKAFLRRLVVALERLIDSDELNYFDEK